MLQKQRGLLDRSDDIDENGLGLIGSNLEFLWGSLTKSKGIPGIEFLELGLPLQGIYSQSGDPAKGIKNTPERIREKPDNNLIPVVETSNYDVFCDLPEYFSKLFFHMDCMKRSSRCPENLINFYQSLKKSPFLPVRTGNMEWKLEALDARRNRRV